jgi:hypothetical protein
MVSNRVTPRPLFPPSHAYTILITCGLLTGSISPNRLNELKSYSQGAGSYALQQFVEKTLLLPLLYSTLEQRRLCEFSVSLFVTDTSHSSRPFMCPARALRCETDIQRIAVAQTMC